MIRVARHFLARRSRAPGRCRRAAWALAPALLLSPHGAHAAALDQYTVQVLAQSGVQTSGFHPIGNFFAIFQMNDHGQISLVTTTKESHSHQVLGVLANGQFTPIAAGGGPSPDGKTWPTNMSFAFFADINESGNVAFVPVDGSGNSLGVYFWDATKHAVNRLATPETPAAGDLVFASGGKDGGATLNNRDEVAFVAAVKGASGPDGEGVFLRRADGHIDPVALPGDALPGQGGEVRKSSVGASAAVFGFLGLNDAGQVTFPALGTGIQPVANRALTDSIYRWENGTISLVAESGTVIPGLGNIEGFNAPGLNNQNNKVLLTTWTPTSPGINGILLWDQGQLVPVLLAGQELPGGGQYKAGPIDSARPNELGQYPFVVQFQENGKIGAGAYLVDADGKLSLIARTGMTTPLGTLTRISPFFWGTSGSSGLAINQQGQVVLIATIDNGPEAILLLTPKSPADASQTP
jgi:hypothetical protein